MEENDEYIQKLLKEKAEEYKSNIREFDENEINSMIGNAKRKIKIRLYNRISIGVCSLVIIVAVVIGFIYGENKVLNNGNVDMVANNVIIELDSEENYTNVIPNDSSRFSYLSDISNVNEIKNVAQHIVIAKIESIDGCTNYSEKLNKYTRINTFGSIKILEVLKGKLKSDTKVPFIRKGGTILYSEYEKGDRIKILNEEKKYKYVTEKMKDEVDIEKDKIYLMFLYYDEDSEKYEIIGNQYGLREYNVNTKMVKNNITKEEENLSDLGL